jgi:phage portal protein BeeE
LNLIGALFKSKGNPYAGTASGFYPGGNPWVDVHHKTRAPGPVELIRENLGTAASCGALNSQLVARTRLRLYVTTRAGEGKSRLSKYGRTKAMTAYHLDRLEKSQSERVADAMDIEEVKAHPVLSLLKKPNAEMNDGVGMTLFTMIEMLQLYLEIVGRSYLYAERGGPGKTPSQLWILAPQFVTEWPGTGEDAKIIEWYEFAMGSGNKRYSPDDVVPFRMPDPMTGGYTGGVSPLRLCFEAHSIARDVDSLTNARVTNGARPDAIFTPEGDGFGGGIGRDEAARLEMILRRRYSMAGAGAMMVSDIPGKITPIAWAVNDIIDASRYELTRSQIAEAYHVPMSKLNRDQSTFAGAHTGEFAHAMDAGLPRLRRFEAALNTFLLPMYGEEAGERLFFAFDDPKGLEDPEIEQKRIELAGKYGMIRGNEYRSMIGKKDVPEGERYLASNALVPLLADGRPDPAYIKGAGGGPEQDDEPKPLKPTPVPAQANEPAKPKKKKPTAEAKAMLKMAKAVHAMAKAVERPIPTVFPPAVEKPIPPAKPEEAVERPAVVTKSAGPHEYSCVTVRDVRERMRDAGYSDDEIDQKLDDARNEMDRLKADAHKAIVDLASRPPVVPHVTVNLPQQPPPVVTVNVPEQPSPVVNVSPVVIPAPQVTVQPTQVTVNVPEQPAPVVNVNPPAKTVSKIVRDQYGEITEVQHD